MHGFLKIIAALERFWKRNKWYIIGYIIYVCFISTIVSETYDWDRDDYLRLWVVWCVMIPLILYCVYSYIIYRKNKS